MTGSQYGTKCIELQTGYFFHFSSKSQVKKKKKKSDLI